MTSFDPVNPAYKVVKVIDIRNRPPFVIGGNFWNPNSLSGANWTKEKMGNVFGITMDDANPPNIYVARSTVYCGTPDTLVGLIYKINGATWAVSNYVMKNPVAGPSVIGVNKIPNTGPGLGNLCFDAWHQQIFTTNHEDGKIYRIKTVGVDGKVQSVFDPFTADAGTNTGFVARGERIWGIGVFGNSSTNVRVYFSRWVNDRSQSGTGPNQIWSIALDNAGEFVAGSVRLEITLPLYSTNSYSNPVSDIEFSHTGTMLLGERTMFGDSGPCAAHGLWAHQSRILEYPRNNMGLYSNLLFTQHNVGLLNPQRTNSSGGVDFEYGYSDSVSNVHSLCDTNIVGTGDYLFDKPGPDTYVYGVQFFDKNFGNLPNYMDRAHFIDLNGLYGTGDKTTPGDIDVYKRDSCSCHPTVDLWMKDDAADIGTQPYPKPVFWNSPDIWVSSTPGGAVINPDYGSPAYVNVRVRNKSLTTASCGGTLTLQWAKASSALTWTSPWFGTNFYNAFPMGGSIVAQTIPDIPANSSVTLSYNWTVPNPANYSNPGNHDWDPGRFCFLARIETATAYPYGMTFPEVLNNLKLNVDNNNNIAMKNVDVFDIRPNGWIYTGTFIGNFGNISAVKKIVLSGPATTDSTSVSDLVTISARLNDSLYQMWAAAGKPGNNIIELPDSSIKILGSGAYISGINLPANSSYQIGWKIVRNNIADSLFLPEYNYDIIQYGDSNIIDGGNRITIHPISVSTLNLKLNFQSCPNIGDIKVELRNSTSPYSLVDTAIGKGGGNISATFDFRNAVNGIPYYIVVKSVNSLETWSSTAITFSSSSSSYDFTTAISKAYGNNQILSNGIPSVYQGDVSQDGFVDITDVLDTYNESSIFITSPSTDFNCDGTTDLSDVILAFNNASNFVQVHRP